MAKKSMKEAAAVGTTVFERIATGNVQNAENIQDTKDVKDAINTKNAGGRPLKYGAEMVRLNLKVPVEIKDYLQAAAYRESNPRHMVSLTEYFCDLVRRDMEQHKDD